jgi:hypothetical protein
VNVTGLGWNDVNVTELVWYDVTALVWRYRARLAPQHCDRARRFCPDATVCSDPTSLTCSPVLTPDRLS